MRMDSQLDSPSHGRDWFARTFLAAVIMIGVGPWANVNAQVPSLDPATSNQPNSEPFRTSLGQVNPAGLAATAPSSRPVELPAALQDPSPVPKATFASRRNQDTDAPPANSPTAGVTRVTRELNKLPNAAGQVWREYDISPYTSQITTTETPQKAVLDWVLRETGKGMWFNEPLGVLSIDKNHLYVYHTPEIQSVVKNIVDRFVRTRAQMQSFNINLVTVENPNWRAASYTMLQPIDVQSPGVEAWMISKENAALLLGQLSRRPDFKQHSAGRLRNYDGQPFVLEKKRPVQFVRSLRWIPNQVPNYQPLLSTIQEGYKLEISCLSANTNDTIEAVIRCEIDQVEKLNTVRVNVPGINGNVQQMHLQIPQLVSWRLHERFKWPNDQVLLLSCGVVAALDPDGAKAGFKIPGLPLKSKRSDALLFLEYRGPDFEASVPQTARKQLSPIGSPPSGRKP